MKFTKGEENLISEFSLRAYGDPFDTNKTESRKNPYSLVVVHLNPFCANLVDQILKLYHLHLYTGSKSAYTMYSRLKHLLVKLDSPAYMDLID